MTIQLMCAFILAFLFATAFGKYYIPWLRKQKAGQAIKSEVTWHEGKKGTPTMGGVIMLIALVATVLINGLPNAETYVLLGAIILTGALGLFDDASKVIHERSLGLTPRGKLIGQFADRSHC